MACAAELDLEICKGATFRRVFRWEAGPIIYKSITAITKTAPARLTVTGHGVPPYWRIAIVNVLGMKEINAENFPPKAKDYVQATVIDPNTIDVNSINAAGFKTYTSGGQIMYNTPVSLTGYTARMDIKTEVGGTLLYTLSTTNSRIVLDTTDYEIELILTDAETQALTFEEGVYTLEMEAPGGDVTPILTGKVTVHDEITTTSTP